jgi:hypothetical protein
MESPNTEALCRQWEALGVVRPDVARAFRTFNAYAPAFRAASESHERE